MLAPQNGFNILCLLTISTPFQAPNIMSNAVASLHFLHMDCSLDGAKSVHQHEKATVRVKENIREPECVALTCLAQLVVAKRVLSVRGGRR